MNQAAGITAGRREEDPIRYQSLDSVRSAFASLRSFVSKPSVKEVYSGAEERTRFPGPAVSPRQARQAHRTAERQGSRLLLPSDLQGAVKATPGRVHHPASRRSFAVLRRLGLFEKQLALDPPQLGSIQTLEVRLGQPNAFLDVPQPLVPSGRSGAGDVDERENHITEERSAYGLRPDFEASRRGRRQCLHPGRARRLEGIGSKGEKTECHWRHRLTPRAPPGRRRPPCLRTEVGGMPT